MFPITQPNIINVAELRAVVTEAMAELPSDLERHRSGIQACLTRAAATHDSVRPARRRQGDPAWAQVRFDQGDLLHRFDTRRADQLIREIQHLLSLLQRVGCRATNRPLPLSAEVEAWLRGLAHRYASFEALSDQAEELLGRAAVADLRADRHKALRTPRHVSAGGLSAVRCTSVAEIMGLGRVARNCMVTDSDLWKRFANGVADVWSVRRGPMLVAVLEVHRASGTVVAVAGPRNRRIASADAHPLAQLCRAAGLQISDACEGLRMEFAEAPVLGPITLCIEDRVASYTEWSNAVRIDLSTRAHALDLFAERKTVQLALSFATQHSCVDQILSGDDPRGAIKHFGRKKLRRIVSQIALSQVTPSMVQHRLLALSA